MKHDTEVLAFLQQLPKAELHLHIEGTLEPELQFKIAERNKIKLVYPSVEHLKALYNFSNLQSFLDLYYTGVECMQTEEDYYDLTLAFLERVNQDGCRHVEIFFDPQSHTNRGVSIGTVISGICRAFETAKARFGITAYLIMCFLRHLSEKEAFETLEQAIPYFDKIKGVGLDSTELGQPKDKFERVFAKAKELGMLCVAHAGEEGPAENIWACLNQLNVLRIDHGVNCVQDEKLLRELIDKKTPLTVCPLSNIKLKVFQKLEDHNLKKLFDMGIRVTINSDDPAYFGGYLLDNYVATYQSLDLTLDDMVNIAKNSFEASFLPKVDKERHLQEIDRVYEQFKLSYSNKN